MKMRTKNVLNTFGQGLAIVGVVYVVAKLYQYNSEIELETLGSGTWFIIALFTMLYGFSNLALSLAWKSILLHFKIPISSLSAIKIYGITQVAKYVPGNIMHLASRQTMGTASGIPNWPLAKSTAWELILITLTAAIFAIFISPLIFANLPSFHSSLLFPLILSLFLAFLARYLSLLIAKAVAYYVIFLSISGLLFAFLLTIVAQNENLEKLPSLALCGSFVIAWLVGLITPGSPAGIGVREVILTLLLKDFVPVPELILCISLSRIITVGGDLLFFLFASTLPPIEKYSG